MIFHVCPSSAADNNKYKLRVEAELEKEEVCLLKLLS
jgi:hypothetical protein